MFQAFILTKLHKSRDFTLYSTKDTGLGDTQTTLCTDLGSSTAGLYRRELEQADTRLNTSWNSMRSYDSNANVDNKQLNCGQSSDVAIISGL